MGTFMFWIVLILGFFWVIGAILEKWRASDVRNGNERQLRKLDPNGSDFAQSFFDAAQMGVATSVRVLLERGASPRWKDRLGRSPLFLAVSNNRLEVASMLLKHGANACEILPVLPEIDTWQGERYQMIHMAAKAGNTEMVRLLLQHGANPNAFGGELEETPIVLAAIGLPGTIETLDTLLAAGAEIDSKISTGVTALHILIEMQRGSQAKTLLERGANPAATDDQGRTALTHAVEAGAFDLVQTLLDRGMSPTEADISIAKSMGFSRIEEELIKRPAAIIAAGH